jgi:hypothetical protein
MRELMTPMDVHDRVSLRMHSIVSSFHFFQLSSRLGFAESAVRRSNKRQRPCLVLTFVPFFSFKNLQDSAL